MLLANAHPLALTSMVPRLKSCTSVDSIPGPYGGSSCPVATATQLRTAPAQSIQGVTHLGDLESATYRADVQAAANIEVTELYEVRLPCDLKVFPTAYFENHGQDAMKTFENMLLASGDDIAYTWNKKESKKGSWSVILRRESLGDLPSNLAPGVSLVSRKPWNPGPLHELRNRA